MNAAEPKAAATIEVLPAEYLDTTALFQDKRAARAAGNGASWRSLAGESGAHHDCAGDL